MATTTDTARSTKDTTDMDSHPAKLHYDAKSPTHFQNSNALHEYETQPHANFNAIENNIMKLPSHQLSMIRGPFHYQIRAGSFGDVYDEIPWRVMVGLDRNRNRDPIDKSLQKIAYNNCVLIHNCYEERRDRNYIRNHRTPISQYAYMYTTTYGESIGKKRMCNKERAHLQTMKAYPLSAIPAYQPELNVDMLRYCVPKPEECCHAEAKDFYDKAMARQKRYDDVAGPPKEIKYNMKDLAKCKHWP